ncbi:MAG TPA: class I SAM-dependent methyltransferase family protein [Solirubrobacteraceae bacterium]|nr:class I SAM-dependent methyltransferase family protein [Solirubrobacteraceae bacterium]
MPTATETAAAPTFTELQRELPALSPRAWRFGALAAASRAGALLSEGLRIGYEHGFDSGPFMAHVYANVPRGRTPAGVLLDRRLLARRTCRAFREIRELARRAIDDAIAADGTAAPVIADLAAGPAPYVFAALQAHPDARAVLGDIDPAALDQARAQAARLGVTARTTLTQASAFDRAALEGLDPRPSIVVELGLYGIYHDDALIERHFRDLADTIAPGQIVFNVQMQNPEIEYIARVWRDHRGERCVWRLRPLELILAWAGAAGYELASVATDSQGIYSVGRLKRCEGASA